MTEGVRTEISLSTFDADWHDLLRAAAFAEEVGIGGIWVMDHLSGAVHERRHVLECLTVLGGVVGATERARVGSLVLNCGTRHPSVVAQATATLQAASGGRIVVGVGAGGGAGTPYAQEMVDAGFADDPAPLRRRRVADTLAVLAATWADDNGAGHPGDTYRVGPTVGFLHPDPRPRTLVAGFGVRMAALAGTAADAFNTHAGHPDLETLNATACEAAAAAGRPRPELTVFHVVDAADDGSALRSRAAGAGVDTEIAVLAPPFDHGLIRELAEHVGG